MHWTSKQKLSHLSLHIREIAFVYIWGIEVNDVPTFGCFGRFCRPVMTKPKPAAKPAEAPQAKAADEEKSEPEPAASSGEEPMETEKPTQDSA